MIDWSSETINEFKRKVEENFKKVNIWEEVIKNAQNKQEFWKIIKKYVLKEEFKYNKWEHNERNVVWGF